MANQVLDSTVTTDQLLPTCICPGTASEADTINGIPVLRCGSCGIIRQSLAMTPADLGIWYRDRYFKDSYQHTYQHDVEVSIKRLVAYKLDGDAKILDVGCGNDAFVDTARDYGLNAWGQDLSTDAESPHCYVGALEDVAFPTDGFDVITVHDVLEHVVNPVAFLAEIARICKPGGKLIIDFPRFYHESGKHHWKHVEHLWMLDEIQVGQLMSAAGFAPLQPIENPIPSKFVITGIRRPENRPKILTPAGIGDTYWVIVKLRAFLKKHGLGMPDLYVQDSGGPKRTHPFVETIPFVHAAGYHKWKGNDALFQEAYMQNKRTIFPNVLGMDYFMAYNGILRFGRSLEDVDTDLECEWFPKMHVSKTSQGYRESLQRGGKYCVVYIVDAGMYRRWLAEFPIESIRAMLHAVEAATGFRMIFIGAGWDANSTGWKLAESEPGWTNLITKTTYDELVGTLSGASLILGWPSGATILGPVLRVPTVMFWNQYFRKGFWTNSVPAGTPYAVVDTKGLTAQTVLDAVAAVLSPR